MPGNPKGRGRGEVVLGAPLEDTRFAGGGWGLRGDESTHSVHVATFVEQNTTLERTHKW